MSDFTNDPRLTDYVLGELDEAQSAEVERLLDESPSAREIVNELRELSGLLTESLKSQPAPALTDDQRAVIVAAAAALPPQPQRPQHPLRGVAVVLATLTASVAAVLAVVANLQRPNENDIGATSNARVSGTEVANRRPLLEATVAQNSERKLEDLQEEQLELLGRDDKDSLSTNVEARWGMSKSSGPRAASTQSDPAQNPENLGTVLGPMRSDTSGRVTLTEQADKLNRPVQNPAAFEGIVNGEVTSKDYRSYNGLPAENFSGTVTTAAPVTKERLHFEANRAIKPVQEKQSTETNSLFAGTATMRAGGTTPMSTASTRTKATTVERVGVDHDFNPQDQVPGQQGDAVHTKRSVVLNQIRIAAGDLAGRRDGRVVGDAIGDEGEEKNLSRRFGQLFSVEGRSDGNTEAYDTIIENPFILPTGAPLSTFSIDVDTASYSNTRRFLSASQKPPRDSVRVEELVNYFRYEDAPPTDGKPFAVHLEVGACPWAADHRVVRVALKGKEISKSQRPATNLVFLLDVSGSMRDDNKLPLVKQAMKLLVNEMTENDRIAIVTYAGNAGLVLDSTSGDKKDIILKAIENLNAEGSTNGEAGIKLAYSTAVAHLYKEGSNRVILCTDGDFNVGVSDDDELVNLIQQKARDSQVFLSIFGFGMGNLKDGKLEKLADKGNGHYGYVDNLREAKKVFVEDLTGTLYTIAKDVKLQVEFNPAKVGAYRLIGYENRVMPAQDFNDDTKDAGEIGAGHSVVALYEIVTTDKMPQLVNRPELKYQTVPTPSPADAPKTQLKPSDELLTVWLRFKQPDGTTSDKLEFPLADKSGPSTQGSRDFQWTTAVAAFGMLLRESQFRGQANFDMVLELAQANRAGDEEGHRAEFIELVKVAKSLYTPAPPASPATVEPANPR